MNDQQWQDAWAIFRTARDLDDEERRSFLASVQTDPDIYAEVVSMLEEPTERSGLQAHRKAGDRFSRYEIVSMLASGGMGQVYSAHDTELGRMVALKFLAPEMAANPVSVDRLMREAKAASALNHPHIVTVYEVIRTGDDVAIAMELVEGTPMRNFCSKPQEISQVVDWGGQIAQALAAAHQRNIIHRDIKPENLMVRGDGILKVLDFGLARHAGLANQSMNSSVTLAGTLNYMAPEQTRAEAATSASDIFSLGIVLFELSTGTHPFRCDSPIDTAHAIAHAKPRSPSLLNPGVPSALSELILAMLRKDPRERPSATEVDRQLAGLRLSTSGETSRRFPWWAGVALMVLAGGLVTVWAFRERLFPPKKLVMTQLTTQVNENRVTAAAVSADGKTLAFATFGGPIFLRRMSDGFSRPLTTPEGLWVDRIAWFADGSKLLVSGSLGGDERVGDYQADIWVMAAAGGKAEKLFSDAKNGVPSPDGTRIALTSADSSIIWVAGVNGSNPRQIRNGGQTSSFSSLIWSPDNNRVVYQRRDVKPAVDHQADAKWTQTERAYLYSYESVDVETGKLAAQAKDFVMTSACGLPDGRVLFLRWISPELASVHRLWELRTDPGTGRLLGQPRQLTHDESNIAMRSLSASDDGKQVVLVRSSNTPSNIWIADLPPAGQTPRLLNIRRLTFSQGEEFPHAWTADSRQIIFESNRNGPYDLYRQRIDRRESEPLVVSPVSKVLAQMSPDGQWILYHEIRWQQEIGAWQSNRVMRIPVEGGTPEPVLTNTNIQGEFRCGIQPGARCVVRTVERDQFVFYELDALHGQGNELARTGWSPTIVGDWDLSPDGSQVAIPNHDSRDARIRLVALDQEGIRIGEKTVTIGGLTNLNGVVWAADGGGWYVSTRMASGGLLTFVDLQSRVSRLLETVWPTFAVPSPDGRRIAFPEWTAVTNVWRFDRL